MAITYMQRRRSGIYEFRRMLPRSLAGKEVPAYARDSLAELTNSATGRFKRELAISLRTADPNEGKRRDLREASRVSDLFAKAEQLMVGPPAPTAIDLDGLHAFVLSGLLSADALEREEGDDRRRLQTSEKRALRWPDLVPISGPGEKGMAVDHFHAYGDQLRELRDDYRQALARRDPKIVNPELREALKALHVSIDPASPGYREAGLQVLSAHVKAYELMLARQAGEDVPTPSAKQAGSAAGPKLSEAYQRWKSGSPARGAKRPGANTIREADHAVRRFTELHGDLRLGTITRDKAREFRDALAKLPTRLPERLRRLSLPRIIERSDVGALPAPHANTVNKSLTLLSAITTATERDGLLDDVAGFTNPFGRTLKLTADRRQAEGRQPFSDADLKAVFSCPVYTAKRRPVGGGGEAAFWLPLIGLLTGARQGELAQLRVEDLRQDLGSGIWFLDIGTSGGRTLKTATSRRKVPVHPTLEKIGLLRYRQSLTAKGAAFGSSLWPDIRSDSAGRVSGPWSKWFNRYLRDVAGLTDERLVFHSFRHTFKRMARDAGLSEEMHDALTGHSAGGVGRSYGFGFGLEAMASSIARIPRPASLNDLVW